MIVKRDEGSSALRTVANVMKKVDRLRPTLQVRSANSFLQYVIEISLVSHFCIKVS